MVYKKPNSNINTVSNTPGGKLLAVRVLDIILDLDHPFAQKYGGYDAIGTINFTYLDNNTPLEQPWVNNNVAHPLFSFIKKYPLINEITLLLPTYDKNTYKKSSRSNYYFPSINVWNHPHHNALPTALGLKNKNSAQDYQESESGLTRQVTDGSTEINLGRYFKEQLNIKPLLPYEGDTIFEGRFGNSIRLGSTSKETTGLRDTKVIPIENKNRWSNEGDTGDPIIVIRNGQRIEDINDKGWEHTVEDIDKDPSSIYLTSNQQLTNFKPASDNGDSYYASPSINL
tara:strand:- start:1743 stop:2597 length:855 start_codon:yes stop_codon:yes gene_type:complete